MLLQIRDFMLHADWVSSQQLQRAFHLDVGALEPMLARWIQHGVMERRETPAKNCLSRCFKCPTSRPVYYRIIKGHDAHALSNHYFEPHSWAE